MKNDDGHGSRADTGCRHHPVRTLVIPLSGDWPQCQRCKTRRINAHTFSSLSHTHTHTLTHAHTATYNSFMSIFLAVQCIPAGSSSIRVQKQGRSLPPISLFFLRLLLSHLSPSMSFYLHCRLFSSNSLPDRGRGAALLLRAEHRGLCRADHTQKRWFTRGCFVVAVGPR